MSAYGGRLSRRNACVLIAGVSALAIVAPAEAWAQGAEAPRFGAPEPFSREQLVGRARTLAARPYQPRPAAEDVAQSYDAAGKLAYGEAERIAEFVRLLPVSSLAAAPVVIHVVEGGTARTVQSFAGLFSGGTTHPAGFRIMAPDLRSDWLSYQGASYFRASGSQEQYGLSARGVAVDTALPRPEEFPSFTEFWIERKSASRFIIHALLDGPSLTGAFTFDSSKGAEGTTQDVTATLFLRKDIERLGIAPATSMFWYGEGQRPLATDWRPEVHDSDGLALWSGTGERIWRPLYNPAGARTAAFAATDPKGFGLIQRDRDFADYQDDGVWYDRRPNLWVEPQGAWGKGAVMLYEMPTDSETADNIVAFWLSDKPARKGERRDLRYRLHWTSRDLSAGTAAHATNIWIGASSLPGGRARTGAKKFVIDFEGPVLQGLDRNSGVQPVVDLPTDALFEISAYPVLGTAARWRVVVDTKVEQGARKEFRLFLRRGDNALSETVIQPLEP
ncbi:glucan biosynthesis protein [Altererythrobacter sp. B11]|uniref:glucan biosynthesis protein n=1 Tax=Altererythrobacter sp. B11 TaxID=2060312 RepID=UPI000E5BF754|nr:glucan biosynthesis protein [Altererythrobacter sp. B11]